MPRASLLCLSSALLAAELPLPAPGITVLSNWGRGLPTGALPPWEPTFDMGRSTIIEPCSNSDEPFNATLCAQYGICDYDWSNQKPLWSSAKPMNCSETLVEQARLTKAVNK